ncbi:MAG: energy-coupling factor transporter transmembrane component T [Ktedonobacteraceae bacterium]
MNKRQQRPQLQPASITLSTSQKQPGETIRHLDPRAALLTFLIDLIGVFVTGNVIWLLGEVSIAVVLTLLCRAGRKLLVTLRMLLFFLLVILVASWWEGGLHLVIITLARVLALVAGTTAFLEIAPPEDVVEALQQWGLPLQVAFVVSIGLHFVPLVAVTYHELREAQEARGIRFTPFWRHVHAYVAIVIPLLREVFRLADSIAQAMESRGFSATPRTLSARTHWYAIDVLIILLSLSGSLIVLLFGR